MRLRGVDCRANIASSATAFSPFGKRRMRRSPSFARVGQCCASCSSRAHWTDGAGDGGCPRGLGGREPGSRRSGGRRPRLGWLGEAPRASAANVPAIQMLHLEGFDGPMDLLLDLAERQRIDWGRMSILALAEQFVAALERLSDCVAIERRADWLVMATRLVLWSVHVSQAAAQNGGCTSAGTGQRTQAIRLDNRPPRLTPR